jgi:NAD(P)-dependent dehydrogenase (short-subunit alcohol dehydrogenase family)
VDLQLAGDVVLVTGAAQGMGRAIALAFAAEGAHVALVDRDPRVKETAQELAATSKVQALPFVVDITDYAGVVAAVADVIGKLGRCDHGVHAAAVGSGKLGFPFWRLEPSDWDRVLRVNVIGAVNVAHALAPVMAEAKRGSLLFLASVAGQIGSQTDPPYSASKAALINFTQCAAKDLAASGVRVNALCPGMVQTALNRSTWEAWNERQPLESRLIYDIWAADKIAKLVPLGRWQEPEDIAAMAVFLASPRSHNVTGQTINVDGGYVMH